MNVITRGVRNALRSPVRSGAIALMLAMSIGLVLAMLVARASVNAKISEVKASTATGITINPAGFQGGLGGGDPLTDSQVKTVKNTPHIASVSLTLADQLTDEDTDLVPSFELGSLGQRRMREGGGQPNIVINDGSGPRKMSPRTSVKGTDDPSAIVPSDKLTSGEMIRGDSSDNIALIGAALAEKNDLSVGDSFTAYGKTVTVKGIFSLDSKFENNGIIIPLKTVQSLTSQPGAVSSMAAKADSSDNVASVVTALKKSLGEKADITSQQEQAALSVKPLEGIAQLTTAGVVAAAVAGAAIMLLAMVMVVRERRREIGIIKAIGGTNAKVIAQFVTEAMTLTLIGGILGVGLGIAISSPMTQSLVEGSQTEGPSLRQGSGPVLHQGAPDGPRKLSSAPIKNITAVTSTLTPAALMGSIGMTLLIALIGSAAPAWAIARVRPAEVLRTE